MGGRRGLIGRGRQLRASVKIGLLVYTSPENWRRKKDNFAENRISILNTKQILCQDRKRGKKIKTRNNNNTFINKHKTRHLLKIRKEKKT